MRVPKIGERWVYKSAFHPKGDRFIFEITDPDKNKWGEDGISGRIVQTLLCDFRAVEDYIWFFPITESKTYIRYLSNQSKIEENK